MRIQKTTSILFYVFLILLLFGGIALFYFSFLSFATVKNYLDHLSSDGTVESFTVERFEHVSTKIKICSVTILIIFIVIISFRKIILTYLRQSIANALTYLKQFIDLIISNWKKESIIHKIILLSLIAIGICIRLMHLMQPISYDEAFTYIYFAGRPLPIALSDYLYPNNHLFHTLLVHLSCSVFGNGLWAVRLPAFLAGCFIVPLTYLSSRRLFNNTAALLASAGIALSNHLIEFSVMARGYSLITACFILLIFLGTEIMRDKKGSWFWFIFISIIGIYTIPVFIQPLAIIIVWLLTNLRKNKLQIKNVLLAIICIGTLSAILYLPPAIVSGLDNIIANDSLKSSSFENLAKYLVVFKLDLWETWFRGMPLAAIIVLASGIICLVFIQRKKQILSLILSVLIVSIVFVLIQRTIAPVRVWQYLLALFYIIATGGFTNLLRKINFNYANKIVFILIILFISFQFPRMYTLKPAHWGEICENEETALFLKSYLKPNDQVKVDMPTDYPLEYYFRQNGIDIAYIHIKKYYPQRVIFVVNSASHQTINEVAKDYYLHKLKSIKKMEFTELFEFDGRNEMDF